MNLLLSYPRSGNTWFRYCVEAITKRRTHGYLQQEAGHFDRNHLGSYVDLGVNENGPDILTKRHAVEQLNGKNVDKLILIVRNYKEVLIRHRMDNWNDKFDLKFLRNSCFGKVSTSSRNYATIIKYFDEFKGPKMILYYEDIITDLKAVLEKTSEFLGTGQDNIDEFMLNLDSHKENSLKIYGASQTKGNTTEYHSKILSIEEKKNWDRALKEFDKDLYSKYLQRYKEV